MVRVSDATVRLSGAPHSSGPCQSNSCVSLRWSGAISEPSTDRLTDAPGRAPLERVVDVEAVVRLLDLVGRVGEVAVEVVGADGDRLVMRVIDG